MLAVIAIVIRFRRWKNAKIGDESWCFAQLGHENSNIFARAVPVCRLWTTPDLVPGCELLAKVKTTINTVLYKGIYSSLMRHTESGSSENIVLANVNSK